MKLMTFNIWNYQANWARRRDAVSAVISEHQPDIVALQETRHDFRFERGRGQGEQLAELTGYHATSATAQVYVPILRVDEGLTILTRELPQSAEVERLSLHRTERRDENHRICLAVTVAVDGTPVHVFDTHFSLSARARQTNATECYTFLDRRSGSEPAFLVGDLNAEPGELPIRFLGGETDIGGAHSDLIDCWTAARPDEAGFTYASWDPVRRIDYVFARNVNAKTLRAEIVGGSPRDGVYPSDHMAVVVEYDAA